MLLVLPLELRVLILRLLDSSSKRLSRGFNTQFAAATVAQDYLRRLRQAGCFIEAAFSAMVRDCGGSLESLDRTIPYEAPTAFILFAIRLGIIVHYDVLIAE